jgi:hypothetical protein
VHSSDLHVACDRDVPVGADVAFRADRLSTPGADQWTLCVSSDRPAIRLTGVAPAALGYVLDRDGVLGLVFPSAVSTVRLNVATGDLGDSEWHFWVVEGRLHDERPTRAGG